MHVWRFASSKNWDPDLLEGRIRCGKLEMTVPKGLGDLVEMSKKNRGMVGEISKKRVIGSIILSTPSLIGRMMTCTLWRTRCLIYRVPCPKKSSRLKVTARRVTFTVSNVIQQQIASNWKISWNVWQEKENFPSLFNLTSSKSISGSTIVWRNITRRRYLIEKIVRDPDPHQWSSRRKIWWTQTTGTTGQSGDKCHQWGPQKWCTWVAHSQEG